MTMPKLKIKKGDTVVVLTGKSKGTQGEVLRTLPRDSKVVVKGVNVLAKNLKPSQANPQGGIERREAPIHVSNVAIADPKSGKATRVGFSTEKDGTKIRVARKSGQQISEGAK
jgi:large subunit ribosomal protein L24